MKQTKLSFIATATGTTYAETALSQWKNAGADLDSLDSRRITNYYFNRAWNTKYATNSRRDRRNEMIPSGLQLQLNEYGLEFDSFLGAIYIPWHTIGLTVLVIIAYKVYKIKRNKYAQRKADSLLKTGEW